jgi:putative MATE family efflux protein
MKDLTKDSITQHIVSLAAPILLGMVTHIAYQLIDLYFITRLGTTATAGVNAGTNALFIVTAVATILNVGTAPLVAHAVGRKDRAAANIAFNQSLGMSTALGLAILILLNVLRDPYLRTVAADAAAADAGATFIAWVSPGLALICPMAALGSGLRGCGIVQPSVVISIITVLLNAALAPILIAGWGTGIALGVRGAGLATTLSIVVGVVLYVVYYRRYERFLAIRAESVLPQPQQWLRIVAVGLPASLEFVLMFLSTSLVYYTIRDFGAATQAGFGIGSRVMQVILLPGTAIAFAVSAIAAQNVGAKNSERVIQTFRKAALMGISLMASATLLVQWRPNAFIAAFEADAVTLAAAALFLKMTSWIFVAQGIVYICSSMFQGLGNTVPSLASSAVRFIAFSACALWLTLQPSFEVRQMWYVLTASVILQALVSLWLLRVQLRAWLLPVGS